LKTGKVVFTCVIGCDGDDRKGIKNEEKKGR